MAYRILVVDDESYIRDLIRDTLTAKGYQVGVAANGVEALDMLPRDRFDIMVTDVVMPGMEGLELVKQVKRLHPQVRIVVLTGYPRSSDIGDFLLQGADDFLPKPFRANALLAVLRKVEQKIGPPPTPPAQGAGGVPGAGTPGR
jgi:DNA-binding response OmpR family regulator